MNSHHRTPLYYQCLLWLCTPFILFLLFREAQRRGGTKRFLKQRLGFGYPNNLNRPLWLHAASVGELNAALPLLERLQKEYPDCSLIITTNTPTAAGIVAKKFAGTVTHCYLPLDYKFAVNRFLQKTNPGCALIMETELWPALFSACRQRNIPLTILNGRLSNKSLKAPLPARSLMRLCLKNTRQILARSEADAKSFMALGANPEDVLTIGNIKFADTGQAATDPGITPPDKPYILAASTHHDEEQRLADCRARSKVLQQYLLVIAPRHPERRNALVNELKPLRIALRSRNQPVNADTDIYLLDTTGELPAFMCDAELVFVGGSLIPHGGQNVLEPARLGKAILTGPHTDNFAAEISELISHDALIQLEKPEQLQDSLEELLKNKEKRQNLGRNARELMRKNADIIDKYLAALQQYRLIQ